MLMMDLNKVWQLPRKGRELLVQSLLLLPLINLALLLLGYYRLRGAMEKLIPFKPIDTPVSEMEILQRAREIARIVSIAAQHGLYKATCLRRSLLVWWFLRREGIQSEIRFGVRMFNRMLEAHAWVEFQGTVVNDSVEVHEHYQALNDVFPPTKLGL
jgi:hypothetical protein